MKKNALPKIAIFDRDGTLIADKIYLSDPAGVELLPRAVEGLRALQAAGWMLLIASNQSGIGRGYFSAADYEKVTARLLAMLAETGVKIAGAFACVHAPDANCACRKPKIGMLEQAARTLNFSLTAARFAVIGDKASDIELGENLGAETTVLICRDRDHPKPTKCSPSAIAENLAQAAAAIIERQ